MTHNPKSSIRGNNKILQILPQASFDRIASNLKFIELGLGDRLDHVYDRINTVLFVNQGMVSLVKVMRDGRSVEVGAIGIEGMTDPFALFGVERAVIDSVVQVPGSAFSISRDFLGHLIKRDRVLEQILQRYSGYAFGQFAQAAACNRLHILEQRAARWILTSNDSALKNSFPLMHEFLGTMLGVPRSGVRLSRTASNVVVISNTGTG